MHQPRLADYGMLLFLGLVWGSSFLFIGVAVKSVPPLTLAALRCLIGALVLLVAVRAMGLAIPREPRAWLSYLAMGLTNSALPFFLIAFGQKSIDVGLAAILIATVPIFTLLLAHVLTDDKTSPRKAVGTLMGFAGIVLLVGPAALAGATAGIVGQACVVGAALCFAITQVLVKLHRGGTPVANAACSLVCSAVWMVPLAFIAEQPWQAEFTAVGVGAVLALGVLSTGLSHLVFFLLIKSTGPSFVTLNNFIAPPVGVAWGILLLGENPPWTAYVALGVILFGIAVAISRPAPDGGAGAMKPLHPGPTAGDYALLVLLGIVFGSTYLFISLGLQTIPPISLAAMRGVVGFVALAALTVLFGHAVPRDARSWRAFVLIGFFGGALPFVMMSYAQQRIDSSLASILITSMPLFTLTLAHFFTDDRASPRKFTGVVIGFTGILLLLGPAAVSGQSSSVVGQLLYVGAAMSYAVMGVLIRRLGAGEGTALSRTACSNAVATVMLVPLAFLFEQPLAISPSVNSILGLLGLGLISSTLGQFLVFRLNATAGPNFTSANNYLGPPVGIMWGVLLLGEEVTWLRLAAMLVIFAGIAFATTRTGVVRQEMR